jgi:hypothetical protein
MVLLVCEIIALILTSRLYQLRRWTVASVNAACVMAEVLSLYNFFDGDSLALSRS